MYFKPIFENLSVKSVFLQLQLDVSLGSEGSAGILFISIHVGIVHLVTRAQKCCHEAALGLLVVLSKTAVFGTFWGICMQNAFFSIYS